MIDERILELINKDIDGVLSPAERTILDEYRSKSPESADVERELRAVATALDGVMPAEAPATLKSRVMRSITPPAHRESAARSILSPVINFFRGTSGVRLAYAFSIGIVAGITLFALYDGVRHPGSVEPADVTGTMIIGSSGGQIQPGPAVPITGDRVNGSIGTRFTRQLAIVDVRITSPDAVRAEFTYDPTQLTVRAVQRGADSRTDLAVSGSTVEVRSAGVDGYTLYFDRKGQDQSPVRVALYSAGNLVFSKNIMAGERPE